MLVRTDETSRAGAQSVKWDRQAEIQTQFRLDLPGITFHILTIIGLSEAVLQKDETGSISFMRQLDLPKPQELDALGKCSLKSSS